MKSSEYKLQRQCAGIILLILFVFTTISFVSYSSIDAPDSRVFPKSESVRNLCGLPGAYLAAFFLNLFGAAAFFLLFPFGFSIVQLFKGRCFDQLFLRTIGITFALIGLSGLFALVGEKIFYYPGPVVGPGGYIGVTAATFLGCFVAAAGCVIFLCSLTISGIVLSGDRTLLTMLRILLIFRKKTAAVSSIQENSVTESEDVVNSTNSSEYTNSGGSVKRSSVQTDLSRRVSGSRMGVRLLQIDQDDEYDEDEETYQLPTTEILTPSELVDEEQNTETVHQQAAMLEQAFSEFKVQVKVVDIQTGPVISQFELKLSKGTRLKKVQQLADDIALSLKVQSARVVAPIPGKNTVGVELPNEHRQMVRIREVMELRPDAMEKYHLPVYLGKDVSGQPMIVDLTKLPHLLIAGRTGTGKSVCLNSIIVSMLMTRSPEQVRMLMIDPKMVELSPYKTIPHLMHPVVTDMRKAEAILGWAVEKMEERYQLLAAAGVRQLSEYNRLSEDELRRRMSMIDVSEEEWADVPKSMPYLVIVADEMADLMMTAAKDVETHIIRLAQKSRAVGIHLVLATQKPTVDIVTGLIKSNLPARIAFGVATRTDSQVVLDRTGAERLLGYGDMLFLQPDTGQIVRGQGTYVSDEEIESIIELIGTDEPDFVEELIAIDPDAEESDDSDSSDDKEIVLRDDLYNQAVEFVIQQGRGSLSLLQRRFRVGYGRAARMIDFMAEDGVVGAHNGAKAREVIMTLNDWRRRRGGTQRVAAPQTKKYGEPEYNKFENEFDEDFETEYDDEYEETPSYGRSSKN